MSKNHISGDWQAAGENTTTKTLPAKLHYPYISARGAMLARPITYNVRKWAKIGIFKGLKNDVAYAVATSNLIWGSLLVVLLSI